LKSQIFTILSNLLGQNVLRNI